MNLSDSDLLRQTDELVAQERELLIEILKHLREIDKRRLFSTLGFKSLIEYAVKVEIKFVADPSLLQQLEKLKGLLAHSHPNMSMAELVQKACEMAIHQLEPKCKRSKVRHGVTRAARVVVWQKAQGRCQNCGSVHALQIDHEHPRALGGTHDESATNARPSKSWDGRKCSPTWSHARVVERFI